MHFTKMQGVGNDFVVIEQQELSYDELPALARFLCDRKFSIGADGLLVIGSGSNDSAFSFRMFNPDGSEDMCGNGLRCACLWAYNRGLATIGDITVSTKDGIRECHLLEATPKTAIVRVNMGPARLLAQELPIDGPADAIYVQAPIDVLGRTYISTVVNTGSTHTVVFRAAPVSEDEFLTVSPIFENLPLFPERTSVLWTWKTGVDTFFVRIWERGAGETLGCGTGACAVGVAVMLNHLADRGDAVTVTSKGGNLAIEWPADILMTGPAVLVFEGETVS